MEKSDFEKEILVLFPTYEDGAYSDENEGKRMAAQHVWDTHVLPLQEKLKIAEHLKELDDDAIVTLQKEVERLKTEVLKEKFPEN